MQGIQAQLPPPAVLDLWADVLLSLRLVLDRIDQALEVPDRQSLGRRWLNFVEDIGGARWTLWMLENTVGGNAPPEVLERCEGPEADEPVTLELR